MISSRIVHSHSFSLFFLAFVFVLALGPLPADESETADAQQPVCFRIRDVHYEIDGHTRESVLRDYLDMHTGECFKSREEVQEFVDQKKQLIQNQRTLAGGDIDLRFEQDAENSKLVHVDIEVRVSDTWNYILLPYGKYDSNEGLLISLRARNYNFLGGMEELAINLDYLKPSIAGNEYSLNSELAIPFFWLDYKWMFRFQEDIQIKPEEPVYFFTGAGLGVDIPVQEVTLQAEINQSYYLNEDGQDDPDGWYMTTGGSLGSLISLGFDMPGFDEVYYTPSLISSAYYKPGDVLSIDRRRIELGARHVLSTGNINWIGNFRDGNKLTVDQNLRWNFKQDRWVSDFETVLRVHKSFGFAGLSNRWLGMYRYGEAQENAGGLLRGIYDRRMDAEAGLFVNIDFPIKTWIWFLDRWFEGHISPFFDYGLVNQPDRAFSWSEGWYSGGLEVFAFSKAARSLYLRASLGLDIEAVLQGASIGDPAPRDGAPIYEVYIGLGHHY